MSSTPQSKFWTKNKILSFLTADDFEEDQFAHLDADEASFTMEFLQTELDRMSSEKDAQYRRRCLKLMRYLNHLHGVLPPSMFLEFIRKTKRNFRLIYIDNDILHPEQHLSFVSQLFVTVDDDMSSTTSSDLHPETTNEHINQVGITSTRTENPPPATAFGLSQINPVINIGSDQKRNKTSASVQLPSDNILITSDNSSRCPRPP
ncbi:hypothetical protein BT96DRAFT_1026635 [Gymnopus androsaceus JB14]|uniref:Uncharacterized protein n=1 Tax=Gymnopus androsaceus JB14 TaxID=1447944 RepID=A0A6A4GIX8_9AGAR|nr:hypothetical protein BT96DRAFT_1026635 [Gymnopus androsaceus JB14]